LSSQIKKGTAREGGEKKKKIGVDGERGFVG